MFEPEPELVSTHRVALDAATSLEFDQTLWGKVIALEAIIHQGGRYALDDYRATAPIRQLLEAATLAGEWAYDANHPLRTRLKAEVLEFLALYFNWQDEPEPGG